VNERIWRGRGDGDSVDRGRRMSRFGEMLRKFNCSKSRDGKSVGQSVVSAKSTNSVDIFVRNYIRSFKL